MIRKPGLFEKWKARLAVCLCFIVIMSSLPSVVRAAEISDAQESVEATEEAVVEPENATEEPIESVEEPEIAAEVVDPQADDNEELFEAYVDEVFYGNVSAQASASSVQTTRKANRGSRLSGVNLAVYNYLREGAAKLASGENYSSVFTIPASELSGSAEDVNMDAVINALLADWPYELYWFDKTVGYAYVPVNAGDLRVWMAVASEYSNGDSVDLMAEDGSVITYLIATDTEKTGAVITAVDNARDVVAEAENQALSDSEKMEAYKNYVCEEVSYNSDAAASGGYGNPWQLIWVFDEDPYTDVVCEGYAKAFQYLCDQSDWEEDQTDCILVTGTMTKGSGSPELHMWNVVALDGGRFIADITNSDAGRLGESGQLFLKGAPDGTEEGYTFSLSSGSSRLTYLYDGDTISLFDASERTLSTYDYGEEPAPLLEQTLTSKKFGTGVYTWIASKGTLKMDITSSAPGAAFTYESSNENVLKVSNTGQVTPVRHGTATITVTAKKSGYQDAEKKVRIKITGMNIGQYGTFGSGTSRAVYRVTGQNTVSFVHCRQGVSATKVIIPNTVTIRGASYKVTAVEDKAVYNFKKVQNVIVGKNVITIGNYAFSNCPSLKTFRVNSAVLTSIGAYAFKSDEKLKRMTLLSTKLSAVKCGNCLTGSSITAANVPEAKRSLYARKIFKKSVCGKYIKVIGIQSN